MADGAVYNELKLMGDMAIEWAYANLSVGATCNWQSGNQQIKENHTYMIKQMQNN